MRGKVQYGKRKVASTPHSGAAAHSILYAYGWHCGWLRVRLALRVGLLVP